MKKYSVGSNEELQKNSIVTVEEARKATNDYFCGDELATQVWINKYALKDSAGNLYERSPEDMHRRMAREIARIEAKYPNPMSEDELFELFDRFKYIIPQGGPMTGIGNNFQVSSLSNCFVVGVEGSSDSYGAIIKIDEEQVQLMKRRGDTPRRFAGEQFGSYLHRYSAVYGALFELYSRGSTRRSAWSTYVIYIYQTPRC